MGHYEDQYEADRQNLEQKKQKRLLKRVLADEFDQYFDVAGNCKLGYVMLPLNDAKTMIDILRQQAVFNRLKENR